LIETGAGRTGLRTVEGGTPGQHDLPGHAVDGIQNESQSERIDIGFGTGVVIQNTAV